MTLATRRAIERTAGHLYTFTDEKGRHGPYPGATAITGLQDSLGGSDGLMNWAVNLALEEVAGWWSNDAIERSADWDRIAALARQAKNKARDLGTAIHSSVDQFNRRLPLEITDRTAPYVAQYGAAVYREGIHILGSEKFVVNTTVGFGGTYDSLVEINGERGPLDVKSGKEKPSQRLQLTGLSMGEWHGEAGEEPEPMPELSGVGFILLLRPDGYELIRHEITTQDREHFIGLVEQYHRIKQWAAAYAPTPIKEEIAA